MDVRVTVGSIVVRPDIVFTRRRIAVFVDGCFWHSCPEHGKEPRSNVTYWAPKLARNRDRDRSVDRALAENSWVSIRIWEHEDPNTAADRVRAAVLTQRNTM